MSVGLPGGSMLSLWLDRCRVAHSWCQADTSLECSCTPLFLTTFTELHVCAVTDISFEEQ